MNHFNKTFFDTPQLVLWGEKASEDGKRSRLSFGFRDGRPRFTVNTGAQGAEGMIIFPSDAPLMATCMMMLQDVANGPNESKVHSESLGHVYVDNKPSAEKKVRATLIMGKTKEGMVYMAVIAESYPKLVFMFKPGDYAVFRDANKQVIPQGDISVKLALAYSEQVRLIISQVILSHAQEEYTSGDRKIGTIKPRDGGNNANKSNASKFDDLDDLAL